MTVIKENVYDCVGLKLRFLTRSAVFTNVEQTLCFIAGDDAFFLFFSSLKILEKKNKLFHFCFVFYQLNSNTQMCSHKCTANKKRKKPAHYQPP